MSYLRSNKLQLVGILALIGLLLTVAVFQYRWLGQLSDREHERMRRTLDWATRAVRWEFDRELADLYRNFQVDFRLEESFAEQLADRYSERIETVEGPDILETFYWVNLDEESGLVIEEFTGTGFAELDEWPAGLAHLEPGFADQLRFSDAQFDLLVGPPPLHHTIPALVIQQVFTRPRQTLDELKSISWVIAKLRPDVVLGELIPALSDQYIYGEEDLGYNVGIFDAEDGESLIYSSDAALTPESFDEPDATRDIYALRIWHFNLRQPVNRRAWTVVEESAQAQWSLVVKHQAGSLEAAVATARNRSLALSLGVLAMLGGAIGMIVVSTRRAQRLAAQQMEFVAGVSHELRTPLAVIRSAGENLADEVVHDPERTRQYGDLINQEGRRLSDMVERILLFAKIRSGNQSFQHQPVDIGATIDDAITSHHVMITERSIRIERTVPEDLPPVLGDAAALTSVMQNLLSNALKYSHRDGAINIRARSVDTGKGTEVQIAVDDDGAGVPGSELPHLFEPFFRGERARRAQIQGSGLGLSLVKQVVEAHDGRVEVDSTEGRGTTFLIRLPAAAASISDDPTPS